MTPLQARDIARKLDEIKRMADVEATLGVSVSRLGLSPRQQGECAAAIGERLHVQLRNELVAMLNELKI